MNCPLKHHHHLGYFFKLEFVLCKAEHQFQVMELHVNVEDKDEKRKTKLAEKCRKITDTKGSYLNFYFNIKRI